MKTLKLVSAIAVLFFFGFTLGCAKPVTTEERLAEIAGMAERIDSYKVTMTTEMDMMGQKVTSEQRITFKKPNKVRMSTTSNIMGGMMSQEMYSTGDIMWSYMPAMGMASKMDMTRYRDAGQNYPGKSPGGSMINMFENIPKDQIEYIEDKPTSEGLAYVFKTSMDFGAEGHSGAPESAMSALLPKEMVFWISADTGLPVKTIAIGKNGNTMMEQTYSDLEINPEIDDAIFEFMPPEGVQVMDMTKGSDKMMKHLAEKMGMRGQRNKQK